MYLHVCLYLTMPMAFMGFPPFSFFALSSHLQCGSFSGRRLGVEIVGFPGVLSGRPSGAGAGGGARAAGARAAFVTWLTPHHGGFQGILDGFRGLWLFFHNTKT